MWLDQIAGPVPVPPVPPDPPQLPQVVEPQLPQPPDVVAPVLPFADASDALSATYEVVPAEAPTDLRPFVRGGELVTTSQIAEWFIGHYRTESRLTLQPIRKSVGNIRMDTQRARELLHWEPRRSWQDSNYAACSRPPATHRWSPS